MIGYVLTRLAQADLKQIGDYYLEEAGYRVASSDGRRARRSLQLSCENAGVLVTGVRTWRRPSTNSLEIITILRGRPDIPTVLERLGM